MVAPTAVHLLIIEDNISHQDLLKFQLTFDRPWVHITFVETIEAAQDELERNTFDCVVTDYVLPDGSILGLLKQDLAYTCPFIVISSSSEEQLSIDSKTHGALDFIPKSEVFTSDLLWSRIRHVLNLNPDEDTPQPHGG